MPIVRDLIVETQGAFIGRHSERLVVSKARETIAIAPLLHLDRVLILGTGVSVSSDALEACAERGIPVHFLSGDGEPYASVYAPALGATVVTRREQILAFGDERGRAVAISFCVGKLHGQAALLKTIARSRRESAPAMAEGMIRAADEITLAIERVAELNGATADDLRPQLLAEEGQAARRYWEAVGPIIPASYEWPGRVGRGARDPVNSCLNYGYGILYTQIERCIILAGLDPYAGFIHTDRPGKPSLVLDLIEEFRQIGIDRVVLGLVARSFTIEQDREGLLAIDTRRALAERILEHLDAGVRFEGERWPIRHVMQKQARRLAQYLRRERSRYEPFRFDG